MERKAYVLAAYNYRVTIFKGNDPIDLSFSEVSGLSVSYEAVPYKHGMSFLLGTKLIPGMLQPVNVTLKRGIASDRKFLYDWFTSANQDGFSMTRKRDIVIDLCDPDGIVAVRWKVVRALPTKLDAQGFDANSNDVAIETLELIAHDLQVDYSS